MTWRPAASRNQALTTRSVPRDVEHRFVVGKEGMGRDELPCEIPVRSRGRYGNSDHQPERRQRRPNECHHPDGER